MSSSSQKFRSRSMTLPARVKLEQKLGQESRARSRSPMPFRRLADLLKRKKKKAKGDVDSFNNLPLEKQTWFHGKITADFAERYLRRDGHFLVREDPAKPGSYFIVVRHKGKPIHVPLDKINSSKGTRIKYRTEDSNESFDSVAELIHHCVAERKPLSQTSSVIITHAVSRDATLLSTDDVKNRYVTNKSPANALPPKPPGTGPLQQKKLDKYARKNSDPGLHLVIANGGLKQNGVLDSHTVNGIVKCDELKWTIQPKQREKIPQAFLDTSIKSKNNSGRIYERPPGENEADTDVENSEDVYHVYEKPDQNLNSDSHYDKPSESSENSQTSSQNTNEEKMLHNEGDESYYDKPNQSQNGGSFYFEPSLEKTECQAVYDRPPSTGSQHSLEGQEDLYDKPRASMECLYNSPIGNKNNVHNHYKSVTETDTSTAKPKMISRSSAPSLASPPPLAGSGSMRTSPPKKPNRPSLSRSRSEQTSSALLEAYDSPPSKLISSDKMKEEDRPNLAEQELAKPLDKKGIFLNVMKKIGEKLLAPFLETDCLSLARHLTHVDLVSLWGKEPQRQSWSIEDGTGGAKGLEILTLPQGREIRAQLLERFSNVSCWVATLVVAAGDLQARRKVLSKFIQLADVLSDKLGNLVSFMAVMEGLANTQVTRLHHTWSCLHHQCSSIAILYHSTLKPLATLLSSGAPSPFPGVCLPYVVPLVRYMEMTPDEILHDWAHPEVDLGLEIMLAHLDSGRYITQQLDDFLKETASRLQTKEFALDYQIMKYFQENLNVGNVLGVGPDSANQANKLKTLLQWLSENAENSSSAPSGR